MSRPRSHDPAQKFTISIPRSLNRRLESQLTYTMSRSAWIAGAIKDKLNGNDNTGLRLSEANLESLVARALRMTNVHTAEHQMLLTVYDFVRKPE